jgi:hypothetical protein
MRTPNVFMIGAPKCGTTAMASYLATNPQVFFSRLKEPFFWNTDLPEVQRIYGITTLEKYLQLFENAGPQHLAVAEGSTAYIFSSVAVPRILCFNPSARILVMLRDPVHMVQSWHNELVFGFQEDVADFELAWNLQSTRAQGHSLPLTPLVARFLQYREIGSYANHLEPIIKSVPPEQLKVVVLEEFLENPRKQYVELCRFLGVDDDDRDDFPPVRESQAHVCPAVSRFLRHPPNWFQPAAVFLRRRGWEKPAGLVSHAKRLLRRKKHRTRISPDFEQHLRETFAPENRRLEDLLGRHLDAWRNNVDAHHQPTTS